MDTFWCYVRLLCIYVSPAYHGRLVGLGSGVSQAVIACNDIRSLVHIWGPSSICHVGLCQKICSAKDQSWTCPHQISSKLHFNLDDSQTDTRLSKHAMCIAFQSILHKKTKLELFTSSQTQTKGEFRKIFFPVQVRFRSTSCDLRKPCSETAEAAKSQL